ncbi:SIMPL domain-containing protein [Actinomadura meridiana]|uniref:SIMPL domain-containing protein n=2 Tax=Actinomadura meridiana TaxID=559626 RepID=A0ABP8BWB4_9ACTN
MQMLKQPWGVSAHGTASVRRKPDLVRVRFKVVRLEQTPSRAFEAANDAVQAVRRTLREHGVEDAAVDSSRLGLKSSWSYGTKRKLLGYECVAAFSVESHALDDVQSLLVDLVAVGAHEIEEVAFDVRGKRELRAEARRRAVTAAREKAELYAEAVGVRLGDVVHIEDVNPDSLGVERYRSHSSVDVASEQDLAPGSIVVSAAVILGFSLA